MRIHAGVPSLQQRAGGREQQVGQADRDKQQLQDPPGRIAPAIRLPLLVRRNRQQKQRNQQEDNVQQSLCSGSSQSRREVCVSVAEEQHDLKKDHADGPHHRASAKPRQNVLADQRLDLKQQKRAQKDRRGKCKAMASGVFLHSDSRMCFQRSLSSTSRSLSSSVGGSITYESMTSDRDSPDCQPPDVPPFMVKRDLNHWVTRLR